MKTYQELNLKLKKVDDPEIIEIFKKFTQNFKQYLVEDQHWTQENAKWCRNRIDVGLEILKVNKQFYS